MAENMYSSDHKAVNDKYRKGYDKTKWNKDKKKEKK